MDDIQDCDSDINMLSKNILIEGGTLLLRYFNSVLFTKLYKNITHISLLSYTNFLQGRLS
jgi:hypothetical protein